MTVTSIGYDGTVDEAQWAKLIPAAGASEYGVKAAGDWKVSAHPTTPGGLNVAPGSGWGQGVLDITDAIETVVQTSLPSSGTRWDMVVRHRDWTPPNGATTLAIIQGTVNPQLPTRATNPGVTDDQPLALVQWTAGQTQPTQMIDLRCWAGNGGMFAQDTLTLGFLDRVGARVKIGSSLWSRELDSNGGPWWVDENAVGPWGPLDAAPGWTLLTGRCRLIARGAIMQLQLEARYDGNLTPAPQWTVATFRPGLVPAQPNLVVGYTNGYNSIGGYWVGPNGVQMGNGTSGKNVQINATLAFL